MPPAQQPPEPDLDPVELVVEVEEPIDFETLVPALLSIPEEAEDDAPLGVSPFTRATAITNAEARASQQSQVRSGASAPLGPDQLNALRVEFIDQWDSRWQRDPGRANGPYS